MKTIIIHSIYPISFFYTDVRNNFDAKNCYTYIYKEKEEKNVCTDIALKAVILY